MPITERRAGLGRVPLRIILPQRTPDILDSDKASQFQGALAVMAVAERYMAQENEQNFRLNLEFFSIWGKLTSLLPYAEEAMVYVSNYRRAKEEALREVVLGGEDISAGTETPQNVMLKIWIEQNIPDRDKFLKINPVDVRKPFIIDLRKDVSRRLLQASHGKFFSLHPELREGMMTEEEWERQEAQKTQGQLPVRVEIPQKAQELVNKSPKISKPEVIKGAIPELDPIVAVKLNWIVQLSRRGEIESLYNVDAVKRHALAAGLLLFSSNADLITACYNKDVFDNSGNNLTIEVSRAIKERVQRMIRAEQRKANKKTITA